MDAFGARKSMESVVVIEAYNEKWPEMFNTIKAILAENLTAYMSIEHVGSTAIPGMYAKPIIDIDIIVKNSNAFEITQRELDALGYEHVGNQGITGREVFKKRGNSNITILDEIKHHLYVCNEHNAELKRHLIFRDTLRESNKLRDEYNHIKMEILNRVGEENREGYVEVKENEYKWFFESVIIPSKNNGNE